MKNGYTTLYKYDGKYNNESIGRYNAEDSILEYDPYGINVAESKHSRK